MSSYYTVRQFDSLTWRWYCEFLWNSQSDCEGLNSCTYLTNNKEPRCILVTNDKGYHHHHYHTAVVARTADATTRTWLQLLSATLICNPTLLHCRPGTFYQAQSQLQFQFQLETELASVLLVPATHPSVKVYLQVQLKVSLLYGSPTVYKDLTINIFFSFTRHQTLDTRQQTLDTRQ